MRTHKRTLRALLGLAFTLALAGGTLAAAMLVPTAHVPPPGMHAAPSSEVTVAPAAPIEPGCHQSATKAYVTFLESYPDEGRDVGELFHRVGFLGSVTASTEPAIVASYVAKGFTQVYPPAPPTLEWAASVVGTCAS